MRHEKGLAKELLTGQEDSRFHSAEDGNKKTPLMGSIYFNSTKNHKTQNTKQNIHIKTCIFTLDLLNKALITIMTFWQLQIN